MNRRNFLKLVGFAVASLAPLKSVPVISNGCDKPRHWDAATLEVIKSLPNKAPYIDQRGEHLQW